MKTVFTGADELFRELKTILDLEPELDVDVATYNMYLGISKGTDWSQRYPSAARHFIDRVQPDKLRLIVGQPPFIECTMGCQHCRERYQAGRKRDLDTIRMLGLNARVHEKLHLKYYRIGDLVVVGGINLGASDAIDASIVVTDWEQRAALMDLFEKSWDDATPLLPKEGVS